MAVADVLRFPGPVRVTSDDRATKSPSLAERGAVSAVQISKTVLVEGTKYWTGVPRRGFPPYTVVRDLTRWTQIVMERRPPTWATPHTVVWTTPIARLRDFSAKDNPEQVPTLLLPPQAGHDSCIVDFSPEQSQVKVARAAGLTQLYSLDWVGATQQTRHSTIEDYIAVIDRALDSMGGRANLVGDCQGGWLAAIYAALRPEGVHTLTIAGAPIDTAVGAPQIADWLNTFDVADLAFYRGLVASGFGVLPGQYQLAGFITMKPETEVERQLQLLNHLDDADYVARYRVFEDWFKHTQDIAGTFYLWIVEHLFRNNELVKGQLVVEGQRVELGRITCPVNLLAGATDHITPPPQVFAAADHVGTPADEIRMATTTGGHLGLFMGTEALRDYWPGILADVARRSRARAADPADVRNEIAPHEPLMSAP